MKKYRLTSDTDKNVQYIVQHFPEGNKFVCECKAYVFGKIGYECKHIKKVRKHLERKA